jgi:hypothetical protein
MDCSPDRSSVVAIASRRLDAAAGASIGKIRVDPHRLGERALGVVIIRQRRPRGFDELAGAHGALAHGRPPSKVGKNQKNPLRFGAHFGQVGRGLVRYRARGPDDWGRAASSGFAGR